MKTGEGKTLVATLPAYLNALDGKGVHVVTVNDYLARRDSEWMGRIYRFLGMTVGVIQHDLNDAERQQAYACDITYGTNNEFGFDYLRDNMKFELAHYVQRGHHFAIVDEVDSILIDEARTPLIISGPAEQSTDMYYEVDQIIPRLKAGAVIQGDTKAEEREALEATGDYIVDEKHKTVHAHRKRHGEGGRPAGAGTCSRAGCTTRSNMPLLHHVNQALRAHTLFKLRRGIHGEGRRGRHRRRVHRTPDARAPLERRTAPGRRGQGAQLPSSRGEDRARKPDARHGHVPELLPQVQEARRHDRHGRHRSRRVRQDLQARRRRHPAESAARRASRTPISCTAPSRKSGTRSSPRFSTSTRRAGRCSSARSRSTNPSASRRLLDRRGLKRGTTTGGGAEKHVVLNAKYHAQEAEFVAQAGRSGSVTIATNMAGRGTDILLGGNRRVHGPPAVPGGRDRRAAAQGRGTLRRGRTVRLLLSPGRVLPRAEGRLRAHLRALQGADRRGTRRRRERRRPAHPRHRTPRVAPHRQSAARSRRPPGRSRLVALLSVASGRPDAHLRLRSHLRPDAEARHGRGRADRSTAW